MASIVGEFSGVTAATPTGLSEPSLVRWSLIGLTLAYLGIFLVVPLLAVFVKALEKGVTVYWAAISDPVTLAAIQLTLLTAAIAVPLNVLFGVMASWAVGKFEFPGKQLLITLIDLPFSVSPVISGMIFVLLCGRQGVFGPWLAGHEIKIVFALPGIVRTTIFVTFPYVARELILLVQAQCSDEEEATLALGANGWQTFCRVTLPNVKWGLLYGVIPRNARAIGEFGAVSVVFGHIRGLTNTIPLHVEHHYNEHQFTAAFAVASLLCLLALVTLIVKHAVERKMGQHAISSTRELTRRRVT
jgi:sulfate transport system permease protein